MVHTDLIQQTCEPLGAILGAILCRDTREKTCVTVNAHDTLQGPPRTMQDASSRIRVWYHRGSGAARLVAGLVTPSPIPTSHCTKRQHAISRHTGPRHAMTAKTMQEYTVPLIEWLDVLSVNPCTDVRGAGGGPGPSACMRAALQTLPVFGRLCGGVGAPDWQRCQSEFHRPRGLCSVPRCCRRLHVHHGANLKGITITGGNMQLQHSPCIVIAEHACTSCSCPPCPRGCSSACPARRAAAH